MNTNESDEALSADSSEGRVAAYKGLVLDWLAGQSHGATTTELKEQFPRIGLVDMEKSDRSIEYRDCRWYALEDTAPGRRLADLEPVGDSRLERKRE